MIVSPKIQNVSFDNSNLLIEIDGKLIKFKLKDVSEKLEKADDFQRSFYKISPSGYGIHWPLIDEDLSISALLNNYKRS